jgi:hypothetical protein
MCGRIKFSLVLAEFAVGKSLYPVLYCKDIMTKIQWPKRIYRIPVVTEKNVVHVGESYVAQVTCLNCKESGTQLHLRRVRGSVPGAHIVFEHDSKSGDSVIQTVLSI